MENLQEKLQKIMAWYCPYPYTAIKMTLGMKDRYIPAEMGRNFANDICRTWDRINCTKVHNEMFEGLKTGNDIITALKSIGYADNQRDGANLV